MSTDRWHLSVLQRSSGRTLPLRPQSERTKTTAGVVESRTGPGAVVPPNNVTKNKIQSGGCSHSRVSSGAIPSLNREAQLGHDVLVSGPRSLLTSPNPLPLLGAVARDAQLHRAFAGSSALPAVC